MLKRGKKACDWCGKTFRKKTKYFEYSDGTAYHMACADKVGGSTDLGKLYKRL